MLDWHSLTKSIFDIEYFKIKYNLKGDNWVIGCGEIVCKYCNKNPDECQCKCNIDKKI